MSSSQSATEADTEHDEHMLQEPARQRESASVPVEKPVSEDADRHQRQRENAFARHLAVLGLLINASIWGTLAREGLIALNTYDGSRIQPVIWAQAVGCLVMGWVAVNKETLEGWYPPLFIALGTGFCGSVTTFSTWALQVFQAYSNQNHHNRHGLHNVMDALTQTGTTLGMSLASLQAGLILGKTLSAALIWGLLRPSLQKWRTAPKKHALPTVLWNFDARTGPTQTDALHSGKRRRSARLYKIVLLDLCCFVVLGLGFWLGAVLLAAFQTHRNFRPTTFAIVFGPAGTIVRWYLSWLNSIPRSKAHSPHWPLGTFAANQIATLILAGLFVAQHYGAAGINLGAYSVVSCQVLYGLQEGWCGCLSTISTFAVELRNLRPRRKAVGYAIGSHAVAVCICILVVGIPWWSGGGMDGSCSQIIPYPH